MFGELRPRHPSCQPGYDFNVNSTKDTPYYLGGSDIVKGGDIDVLEYGVMRKACGPPAR